MSAKNRKPAGRISATASSPARLEAERLLAKGRFKDAVKQAKIAFKEAPSEAARHLLERAYLLRAEQLQREAMPTSALEVARHLLDFGITDPGLKDAAARLLVAVGLAREALAVQGEGAAPEARDRLLRQAADQAVLHPDRARDALPEAKAGAAQIRSALEVLEAGDEARALEALRDVARGSPFADWKLFARGLAAFRRRDLDAARDNWDRLTDDRAPARIARRLVALNTTAGAGVDGGLGAIEARVFGEPVLVPLRQLRDHLAEDDWDSALRGLAVLRFKLRRIDPGLAVRLTRIVLDPLLSEASRRSEFEGRALVKRFAEQAEPLPIDPRWHRLRALFEEGPEGDPDKAEHYWRLYLGDLEHSPLLRPEERALARALVWNRIADSYLVDGGAGLDPSPSPFGPPPGAGGESEWEQEKAVECLEESLKLAPGHRATYETLRAAYERWGRPERAAEVSRRLLAAIPDDFDALADLADYHLRRDEPAESLDHARRARSLKPLDPEAALGEFAARVALARRHALGGRWDEGRAELAAAEALRPDLARTPMFAARRIALELKEGEADRAEALIQEAVSRLSEPTPLWLTLRIEATRHQLAPADRDRFESRWDVALSKKPRGETAGTLAELMTAYMEEESSYDGRDVHLRQVVNYLRRATRIKYLRADLTRACEFLSSLPEEHALLETLVKRGLKLFPEAPIFPALTGTIEMRKGPYKASPHLAKRHFEKALKLAESSSDPADAALARELRVKLAAVETLASAPLGRLFGGFGGGPGPAPSLLDLFTRMSGADLDDDDDDEPAPAPRRSNPKRKT